MPRLWFSEGILSADYDEHKEAIEFYDKALKIVETAEIYLNKGISLVELEKYEDAVASYDKGGLLMLMILLFGIIVVLH